MFLKIGKSRGSSEKKAPVQKGDAAGSEEALVTQIANLEEVVNKRTKGLEETREQLVQLSDVEKIPEEVKDLLSMPNQAKAKIAAESKASELEDLRALLGTGDAELEKEQKNEVKGDSLSSLFEVEEEENNVLLNLIKSLPEVTAEELLGDAQEVESIMREWQHS